LLSSRVMFLKVQKVFLGLLALIAFSPATAYADDEIRIDMPAGGELKVRNDFGNVSAEVWGNSYVAVSATIGGDGSARLTRSPIIIDNRGKLITISVVRRPIDPVVPIHLKIKVPDNADITTRSSKGTFQTRVGNGDRKIDIQAQSGEILLAAGPLENSPAKQPELIAASNSKTTSGTTDGPAPGDDISEGDVIRVESQLVTLNISVIDRGTNRGLLGLGQSDF
jgi:hypothetical protein